MKMQTKKEQIRQKQLLPNGKPRYIRCYDNAGTTVDRYTVVFTGRYRHKTGGDFWDLCMSAYPFHPQGVGMHGTSNQQIDRPNYGHLGKRIKFDSLPEDCQKAVVQDYKYLWDLE